MNNELRLVLDGTIFKFWFSRKGEDDGGYSWTDANIEIENRYFNYQTGAEFLTFSELDDINRNLVALLDGEIIEKTILEFIEPDMKIALHPKRDLRDDPKYVYVKEGFEIEDIAADFIFYFSLGEGYTDQCYTLPLYRSDIKLLTEFLVEKITNFCQE